MPELVPATLRGRFPDPIVNLVDREMANIDEKWRAWDKNGDKVLARDEFQSSGLARLVSGLALSTWGDWDWDGDGAISRADVRRLLEVAFGVRRLKGEPLRFESGIVVNAMLFGEIDRDHSDQLEHDEFVSSGFDGAQAEERFRNTDANHDGIISFAEWTQLQFRWIDPVAEFLRIDADLDGRIDEAEFLKAAVHWQNNMARHVFPSFDLNRDGVLSLEEYQRTPFVNLCVMWTAPRLDSDNDGLLSRAEFKWGRPPELGGIEAEYFRLFDLNQDRQLDLTEFYFVIDPIKGPRELVFKQRDLDEDGKLSFDEVLGDFKPPPSAKPGTKPDQAYELRLARIEEAFRKADVDHDQLLTLDEFRSPAGIEAIDPDVALHRTAAAAATTGIPATAAQAGDQRRMWLIVGGNAVLLLAVFAYVIFIKK